MFKTANHALFILYRDILSEYLFYIIKNIVGRVEDIIWAHFEIFIWQVYCLIYANHICNEFLFSR